MRKGVDKSVAQEIQHAAFAELQSFVTVVPVEQETPEILATLSALRISHFALTARAASLQEVTLKQLQVLHHDFNQDFPVIKNTDLLKDHLNEGVIFSGSVPKGELLKLIIDNSEQKFNRIIFIDDRLYNLESVEKSFAQSPIRLQSYRYAAADPIVQSFNPVIADILYSIFKYERVLLTDSEAGGLVGSIEAIAQKSFDVFMNVHAPFVEPIGSCEEVRSMVVRCH